MGQRFHAEEIAEHVKFSTIVEAHEMIVALDNERVFGDVRGVLSERQVLMLYGYWTGLYESGHFEGEDNRVCSDVAYWLARAIAHKWKVFIEF